MYMKKKLFVFAAAAPLGLAAVSASGALVINEIDSDTYNSPATDYAEFIEIYSTTGTATPLDGLTLVLFNGNGDVSYGAIDLDGLTTNANGYYVLGTPSVPGADDTTFLVNQGARNLPPERPGRRRPVHRRRHVVRQRDGGDDGEPGGRDRLRDRRR